MSDLKVNLKSAKKALQGIFYVVIQNFKQILGPSMFLFETGFLLHFSARKATELCHFSTKVKSKPQFIIKNDRPFKHILYFMSKIQTHW